MCHMRRRPRSWQSFASRERGGGVRGGGREREKRKREGGSFGADIESLKNR